MKRSLFAIVGLLGLAVSSQAIYITGSISLGGGIVSPSNFTSAPSLSFLNNAMVTGATMDFTGVTLATPGSVSINNLPIVGFVPVTPLWTTAAGQTISFDFTGPVTTLVKTPAVLMMFAYGTFTMPGYQPTPGTWNFTAQRALDGNGNETASWSVSQSAQGRDNRNLPDGGMTAMLIGATLSGLAFLRRKLS
jgi:hypothetical protein